MPEDSFEKKLDVLLATPELQVKRGDHVQVIATKFLLQMCFSGVGHDAVFEVAELMTSASFADKVLDATNKAIAEREARK